MALYLPSHLPRPTELSDTCINLDKELKDKGKGLSTVVFLALMGKDKENDPPRMEPVAALCNHLILISKCVGKSYVSAILHTPLEHHKLDCSTLVVPRHLCSAFPCGQISPKAQRELRPHTLLGGSAHPWISRMQTQPAQKSQCFGPL